MIDYETYVQRDQVHFRIGVQTFTIDYDPEGSEEALEWMRHMLEKALLKLAKGETK